MAPLIKMLRAHNGTFHTTLCVTGQHREMLDSVLEVFKLVPDVDLNIMRDGQDLYDVTSRVLLGLRAAIASESPDFVLVHGDTTTSFAAALAAFYANVPVGHVEAGLRTHDLGSPWPEEANRQLTARIASLHFAPTESAGSNLLKEGVRSDRICITGNTVIDALIQMRNILIHDSRMISTLQSVERLKSSLSGMLTKLPRDGGARIVLITGHRRENFGEKFLGICNGLARFARDHPNVHLVYPIHLNPKAKIAANAVFGAGDYPNVHLTTPLDYSQFVAMLFRSHVVVTDSGGIQEEAPSFGKPVLVTRENTERPEAIEAGTAKLVGASAERLHEALSLLFGCEVSYRKMAQSVNPYGDGRACERIVAALTRFVVQ